MARERYSGFRPADDGVSIYTGILGAVKGLFEKGGRSRSGEKPSRGEVARVRCNMATKMTTAAHRERERELERAGMTMERVCERSQVILHPSKRTPLNMYSPTCTHTYTRIQLYKLYIYLCRLRGRHEIRMLVSPLDSLDAMIVLCLL